MSFESLKSGKRIVVIGGVGAGMSAASKARKLRSDIEILVFEKSGHISYGACGLPYLISDLIKSPGELVSHVVFSSKHTSFTPGKLAIRHRSSGLPEMYILG